MTGYPAAMTTEHLDLSDSRRPWTRPTLRRLSAGRQALASASYKDPYENTFKYGERTYFLGPNPS